MPETETFHHYQVYRRPDGPLWELGRGAMGVTYKAFDVNLRITVALKVITTGLLHSDTAQRRFIREAQAAAQLRHRNVASVYHLGKDANSYFYAMEYIDGETLETYVKRERRVDPLTALNFTLQVTRALMVAAKQNLLHRDIKPANLMLTDEGDDVPVVKVIDFGLAKSTLHEGNGTEMLTMTGFIGTPAFASPDQFREEELDTRSDIYSLGITLWYMLTGEPPFIGPLFSVLQQHLHKALPFKDNDGIPECVRVLLRRMLAKTADDRPATAAVLKAEIDACIARLRATVELGLAAPAVRAHAPAVKDEGTDLRTAPIAIIPPTANRAPAASVPPMDALRLDPRPVSEEDKAEIESVQLTVAPLQAPSSPGTGLTLRGAYCLEDLVGASTTLFRAKKLVDQRRVAIKTIRLNLDDFPDAARRVEDRVERIRQAPHPNLIDVYDFMAWERYHFLVSEWVEGFSCLDLLRQRGTLDAEEALLILRQLAEAMDHQRQHGLSTNPLEMRQIRFGFGGDSPPYYGDLWKSSLQEWPSLAVKLQPFRIDSRHLKAAEEVGNLTVVPHPRSIHRDTQSSIGRQEGDYIRDLALAAYELTVGRPYPLGASSTGEPARWTPFPAWGEHANELFQQAICSGQLPAADCRKFYAELARCLGSTAPPMGVPEPLVMVAEVKEAIEEEPEIVEAPFAGSEHQTVQIEAVPEPLRSDVQSASAALSSPLLNESKVSVEPVPVEEEVSATSQTDVISSTSGVSLSLVELGRLKNPESPKLSEETRGISQRSTVQQPGLPVPDFTKPGGLSSEIGWRYKPHRRQVYLGVGLVTLLLCVTISIVSLVSHSGRKTSTLTDQRQNTVDQRSADPAAEESSASVPVHGLPLAETKLGETTDSPPAVSPTPGPSGTPAADGGLETASAGASPPMVSLPEVTPAQASSSPPVATASPSPAAEESHATPAPTVKDLVEPNRTGVAANQPVRPSHTPASPEDRKRMDAPESSKRTAKSRESVEPRRTASENVTRPNPRSTSSSNSSTTKPAAPTRTPAVRHVESFGATNGQ